MIKLEIKKVDAPVTVTKILIEGTSFTIEEAIAIAAEIVFLADGCLVASTSSGVCGTSVTSWNTESKFFKCYKRLLGYL